MSSNMIMMLLVVGALAVGIAKRCDWFQICDAAPYNYPQAEEKAAKDRAKKGEPTPPETEKLGLGNSDIQKNIDISQTPLIPVTNQKATDAASANKNADESCHFSQACSALVRIWRGAGADPCIPCGAQAKFARSRFSRISYL